MSRCQAPVAVALAVVLAGACASPSPGRGARPTALETRLAQALLDAAAREGRVSTVLVAPGLPPGIASALSALRPTVPARSADIAGLAGGQLLVQAATVGPSRATVTARLGPVPTPRPGLLACGTGLTVAFDRVDGQWRQGDLQILQCWRTAALRDGSPQAARAVARRDPEARGDGDAGASRGGPCAAVLPAQ